MAIILGIDPGSRITGFGIIETQGRQLKYITSGCIKISDAPLAEKLLQIYDNLSQIIRQYNPTEAAIEQVFMAKNADSALKLGQARGVAMVAAATHALTVAEYSARQIKQAVVGTGGADKAQVQHMVTSLLSLSVLLSRFTLPSHNGLLSSVVVVVVLVTKEDHYGLVK